MENFQTFDLAWFILFLPLLAAVGITLFTQRDGKFSAQLSITAVALSFLLSCGLFFLAQQTLDVTRSIPSTSWNWLSVGDLHVSFGLQIDRLSVLMLLIVTGIGGLIHIYSFGYLREDPCLGRYFASLSLFTFSMLGIVLANNFVTLFIFWELVGVSSYLLIGFWYQRPAAADACKKAFLTNRLGDFGFMLGILLVWSVTNSVMFDGVTTWIEGHGGKWPAMASVAGLLIFCGAMGKSAQFPLHVWLPDAMEGPTPVSALIHAATMVAAGVYMLCRVSFIFAPHGEWPAALSFLEGWSALDVIAWIGGITALLAALIAVQQNDIKRILAYSTLSQLGYMVMAIGLGGNTQAMFHLTTHAFFKALLFLAAGSVIHSLHHEQDIWRMGGLSRSMKVTWWTFLIGTLALCGVPPFSGFYSKDAILAQAATHNSLLFVLAAGVVFLTSFYMFRLIFVAFTGGPRSEPAGHAHESPKILVWPLVILAVPSIFAGFFGIETFLNRQWNPGGGEVSAGFLDELFAPFGHSPLAALLGLGLTAFGFSAAWALYLNAEKDPLPARFGAMTRWMRNRFYFDELYDALIRITHDALAAAMNWVDQWIIAGAVRAVHGLVELCGRALRLVQTGNLQTYAFVFAAGVVIVLFYALR